MFNNGSKDKRSDSEKKVDFSKELATSVADLQHALSVSVSKDIEPESSTLLNHANEALNTFVESPFVVQMVNPRSVRDSDRLRILPGQHAGVFIQCSSDSNDVLKLNFWGGLRRVDSLDLKDRDKTMRMSHVQRTDKILEQSVQINWQLSIIGGANIDCWITYNQQAKKFQLSVLNVDGHKIEANPTLNEHDFAFKHLQPRLMGRIRDLASIIPSSV